MVTVGSVAFQRWCLWPGGSLVAMRVFGPGMTTGDPVGGLDRRHAFNRRPVLALSGALIVMAWVPSAAT